MVRSFIFIILSLLSLSALGALELEGTKEVDLPFTPPSQTSTAIFSIQNSSSSENALNISANFIGSDYSFTGGSYPGIAGSCSSILAADANCLIEVEFSPSLAGDVDADLVFTYDIAGLIGQEMKVRLDGHSATIGSGADCSVIAPNVSQMSTPLAEINDNPIIELTGENFTPLTTVSVTGLQVSQIQFHSSQKISFNLATGTKVKKYDLVVSSECNSVTMIDAIDVRATLWVDLRLAANVAAVNPVYDTSRISGYTVDPSYGMHLTGIVGDDWRKGLRFDGHCAEVNKSFDIVVYRTARSKRLMIGLFSDSTQITPSIGNNYHQRQYIGFWNYGTRVNRVFGSQRYEAGGVNWNQSFTQVNTLAGKYIRYHFKRAGQNGYDLEIWEVDSSFNNLNLLRTVTSNKTQTPATQVCPGVVPFTSGDADYYVTGVRIK